jgi:hypothetical protein
VAQHVLDLLLNAVEVGVLIEHAIHAALRARAVVAGDVENECVLQLTHVLRSLDDASDVVVGVVDESGERLDLAGEKPLLISGQCGPILDGLGFGSEPGALGNDAQGDLPGERLLTDLVPALIELALPLGDPVLRHVVRGVGGTWGEVHKERLLRRHGLLELHPRNRLVGHIGHEVVVGVLRQLHMADTVVEVGSPLAGFTAEKSVELVEALMGGPTVVGTRNADLPGGCFMPLAEGGGAEAIETEHLGHRRHRVGNHAGGAGKAGAHLGDESHVAGVVVASRLQRGAGWRTERRGVELIVAQPALGETVEGWRRDRTAERARGTVPKVINEDDNDVRSAGGSLHLRSGRRFHVARIQLGNDRGRWQLNRKDGAVEFGSRRQGHSQHQEGQPTWNLHGTS